MAVGGLPCAAAAPADAPLAQLDRASVYGTEGYWFESSGVYSLQSRSHGEGATQFKGVDALGHKTRHTTPVVAAWAQVQSASPGGLDGEDVIGNSAAERVERPDGRDLGRIDFGLPIDGPVHASVTVGSPIRDDGGRD